LNLVAAFADRVYVLARGHGVITAGTPSDIFMQVDALRETNIDPPLLTELFLKLRERGLAVDIPIHIEQAVNDLVRLVQN
jgi:cobalt/nickel transport system ATP-binding protein